MNGRVLMLVDGEGVGGGVPAWLPWLLVGVGGVLLAGVAVMLLRGRGTKTEDPRAAAELADLKNRLVEVKKLAATVADDLDRRAERLERLIAQADELLERGQEENRPPVKGSRGRALSAPPVDDLAQRVFALADEGHSALQIAQVLRQPVGNVELMLALRGER